MKRWGSYWLSKVAQCLGYVYSRARAVITCVLSGVFKVEHYTGQQRKYTLSETSQTLLILSRWFRIGHPFLSITSKFGSVDRLAIFSSTFSISSFFKILKYFLTFLFSSKKITKLSVICKKKGVKSDKRFRRYCTSKSKNHRQFAIFF